MFFKHQVASLFHGIQNCKTMTGRPPLLGQGTIVHLLDLALVHVYDLCFHVQVQPFFSPALHHQVFVQRHLTKQELIEPGNSTVLWPLEQYVHKQIDQLYYSRCAHVMAVHIVVYFTMDE